MTQHFSEPNNSFDHTFIERFPVFSSRNYTPENIEAYLDDPYFDIALKLASPILWEEVSKKKCLGAQLSFKQVFSLKKYINRMHFRATPFALFSAVGTCNWKPGLKDLPAINNNKNLTAYVHTENACFSYRNEGSELISCNDSIYYINKEFRYLYFEKVTGGKLKWSLHGIGYNAVVKKILLFCRVPKEKIALVTVISEYLKSDQQSAIELLEKLIESQLLYTNERSSSLGIGKIHQKINFVLSDVNRIAKQEPLMDFPDQQSFINLYNQQEYSLPSGYKNELNEAIKCLSVLSDDEETPLMKTFIQSFLTKYDQQSIPLLKALDPEIGIGYAENRINDVNNNEVIADYPDLKEDTPVPFLRWTPVHTFILKKIQEGTRNIEILAQDIKLLESEIPVKRTHTTSMSIIFRIDNEQRIVIEGAGGVSALCLIGRFSANERILDQYKRIAEVESKRNPGILFAELNCRLPERHYNLHTRAKVYPYEICIGFPCTEPDQIPLNDLYLFVENGNLILYSKRLKSRIIPRFSSAYNNNYSDFPVFKFLFDLQFYGVKHNYTFQLRKLFPELIFFPRVTYGDCILELASWVLDEKVVIEFKNKTEADALVLLNNLLIKHEIPDQVKICEADTYLVFNLSIPSEKVFFIECLQNMGKTIVLQEYPFLQSASAHSAYQKQFIGVKYSEAETYKSAGPLKIRPSNIPDKIDPFSWMYLKIYCHPNRANNLLTGAIADLVGGLMAAQEITQWFFINYVDPEFHIRLRFKLKTPSSIIKAREHMKAMYSLQHHGLIQMINQVPYQPEYERYGIKQMGKVEELFFADSEYCLAILKQADQDKPEYYCLLANSIHHIFECCGWTLEKRRDILYQLSVAGFQDAPQLKYKSDQSYRTHSRLLQSYIANQTDPIKIRELRDVYLLNLLEYMNSLSNEKRETILIDLIHMQLNRLLSVSTKLQELTIYYWLYKYYLSFKYLKNNNY